MKKSIGFIILILILSVVAPIKQAESSVTTQPDLIINTHYSVHQLYIHDMNGDGKYDILSSGSKSYSTPPNKGGFEVFLQQTPLNFTEIPQTIVETST